MPGDSWIFVRCEVPESLKNRSSDVSARPDFLKFADGSIAGPLTLHESSEMAGVFDGIDLVRGKSSLDKFCSAAPVQDLPSSDALVAAKQAGPPSLQLRYSPMIPETTRLWWTRPTRVPFRFADISLDFRPISS